MNKVITYMSETADDNKVSVDSFKKLYQEGCRIRGEEPVHVDLYEDLDDVVQYIENSSEILNLLESIKDDRICMAVPYDSELVCKKLPPDGYTKEEDSPLAFISSHESYRTKIVNRFDSLKGKHLFEDPRSLNKWKIRRIEKMYRIGWDKFAKQYIKDCRDGN